MTGYSGDGGAGIYVDAGDITVTNAVTGQIRGGSGYNGGEGIDLEIGVTSAHIVNYGQIYGGNGSVGHGGDGIYVGTTSGVPVSLLGLDSGVVIENYGEIGPGTGGTAAVPAYGIRNDGYISHLVNAQGGGSTAGSGVTAPLTLYGNLPTNYGMIIDSVDHYAQLWVSGATCGVIPGTPSGCMTLDPVLGLTGGTPTHVYYDVVTVDPTQINVGGDPVYLTNDRRIVDLGTLVEDYGIDYNLGSTVDVPGVLYAVDNNIDPNRWNLRVLNFGQDMAEPQRNMLENREISMRTALNYDCDVFDKNGVCVAFKARYTSFDGSSQGAGVLIASKQIGNEARIGAFIDYAGNMKSEADVKSDQSMPIIGAFVAYSAHPDGTGFQSHISVGYQTGKTEFERANLIGTAEKVSGSADVNSMGVSGELAWGIGLANKQVLTPYVGVQATSATREAYSESGEVGVVDDPFSYASYAQKRSTARMGLRLAGDLSDKVSYHIGAGAEYDMNFSLGSFVLTTSDPALISHDATYTSSVKPREWRMNGSLGLGFDLGDNKKFGIDASASQKDTGDGLAVSVLTGLQVRF